MPFSIAAPSENEERLGFTTDDVRAMCAAGILEDRFELIDGEIVPMQAHNPPHMRLKRWLLSELLRALDATHWIDSEPSFYLAGFRAARSFTAPDLIVYPKALSPEAVRGADCSLLIEVSDSSLRRDLGRKARLYAEHQVRDYWVCDLASGLTYVHGDPGPSGYPAPLPVPFTQALAPLSFPELSLTLSAAG